MIKRWVERTGGRGNEWGETEWKEGGRGKGRREGEGKMEVGIDT